MKRVFALAACAIVMVGFGVAQRAEAAVPIINSLSPNTKVAGSGAFVMTVTGSNFTTGSVVRWNGTAISTGYVSSKQLSATVGSSLVASTGTGSVTVYTSGRKGGTSNTLSFTITAPTTTTTTTTAPPPPAPSPLSITTTSLPGGTANASFSCTVAATGGTPAYGWALVNGGGSLPPGLTLGATGAISGTPTQSGTFTFTTQANDSASQIAQKVLFHSRDADPNTTTTPPPDTGGTPLFQTQFESTDLGWDYTNGTADVSISTAPPPGRSGNALQIHYKLCGATDGTCGASSQDVNRWVSKIINPGLTHVFVRGWVYYKSPEPDAPPPSTTYVQRKVFYFSDSLSAGNSVGSFYPTLTSWNASAGKPTSTINLGMVLAGPNCGITTSEVDNIGLMNFDTWNKIQIEMQLNTPGSADGVIRIWVNDQLSYEKLGANIRGTCTTPLSFFSVGRQSNRYSYSVLNEYRYWDDVAVSSSPLP